MRGSYIEQTYRRPLTERLLRAILAAVLPREKLFRLAMTGARIARPLGRLIPGGSMLAQRMRAMLALAPASLPPQSPLQAPQTHPAIGTRIARVALLTGCAQKSLAPSIGDATIRLLTRLGVEVVVAPGVGCCGALTHHMGRHDQAMAAARAAIAGWSFEAEGEGLDAIIVNTSGCGTTVKDYGFMFRSEPDIDRRRAERVSELAVDITEFLARIGYRPTRDATDLRVAYHSACSLQHGQGITEIPKQLLQTAGFTVVTAAEGHLCCGSAGTYNLMQPAIASRLRDRKLANLARTKPDMIAAGNIGCITQLATGTVPVVHTVELLDWMAGGPRPEALAQVRP